MKTSEESKRNLQRSFQEKDFLLFCEEARFLSRNLETEFLLQMFRGIEEELSHNYSFQLNEYQCYLVSLILKSGEVEDYLAWYFLAKSWFSLKDNQEFLDYFFELAKRKKSLRNSLYSLAEKLFHLQAEDSARFAHRVLKTYLPTRELRAAFIAGSSLIDLWSNKWTPKYQETFIIETPEVFEVRVRCRTWRRPWNSDKFVEEDLKVLPEGILLFREDSEGNGVIPERIPWAKPTCLSCSGFGGVWTPGNHEGAGSCNECGKKYRSLYGISTSPAYKTFKKQLKP